MKEYLLTIETSNDKFALSYYTHACIHNVSTQNPFKKEFIWESGKVMMGVMDNMRRCRCLSIKIITAIS